MPQWFSGPLSDDSSVNGANESVRTVGVWEPAGLVAGGTFTSIEAVPATRIAYRDRHSGLWQAMGTGADLGVLCQVVYNGELIVGGAFSSMSGVSASRIARWNGTWNSLGTGLNGVVYDLTVYNGELIAAGRFTQSGGQPVARIARWDGSSWQTLGGGIGNTASDGGFALTHFDGDLIVGGVFKEASGQPADNLARWNGSAWQPMGGVGGRVSALAVYNGRLFAAGQFPNAFSFPASRIALWDPGNSSWGWWSDAGIESTTGVVGLPTVETMAVYNGELIVGGEFDRAGGQPISNIARWNGSIWQPMGAGTNGRVYALAVADGELVVSGEFTQAGGVTANRLARWNGSEWGTFGGGTLMSLSSMTTFLGRVVAGGSFHHSTHVGHSAHHLITWDGARLSSLGTGMDDAVYALKSFRHPGVSVAEELVVGGKFTKAGGTAARYIARWTDSISPPPHWQAMGTGFDNYVLSIERHDNATYAGGLFTSPASGVARWNESSEMWEPLGAGMNGAVLALRSYGGQLYAGGTFTSAGGVSTGGLARWDGWSWQAVGSDFLGEVYDLVVHRDMLVIGGRFPGHPRAADAPRLPGSPNLAGYNGSVYSDFGGGTDAAVSSLLSTGSRLYVAGMFTTIAGVSANRIAYWDGAWHDVLSGADWPVHALTARNGEIHAGGLFQVVGAPPRTSPRWGIYSEI